MRNLCPFNGPIWAARTPTSNWAHGGGRGGAKRAPVWISVFAAARLEHNRRMVRALSHCGRRSSLSETGQQRAALIEFGSIAMPVGRRERSIFSRNCLSLFERLQPNWNCRATIQSARSPRTHLVVVGPARNRPERGPRARSDARCVKLAPDSRAILAGGNRAEGRVNLSGPSRLGLVGCEPESR